MSVVCLVNVKLTKKIKQEAFREHRHLHVFINVHAHTHTHTDDSYMGLKPSVGLEFGQTHTHTDTQIDELQ